MSHETIHRSPSFRTEALSDAKFEILFSKRNVKIAAFVLSLIAAGVIAYKVAENINNKPGELEFEQSNPTIEQQAQSNTQNVSSEPNVNLVELSVNPICSDTSRCLEQQEIAKEYSGLMAKYKKMSMDDFEKLPNSERLAYGDFLVDTNKSYDGYYGVNQIAADYRVNPKELSINSSGQEILDNFLYRMQLTRLQTDIDTKKDLDNMFFFNTDNAKKLLSSIYTTEHLLPTEVEKGYWQNKEKLDNREQSTWIDDKQKEVKSYDVFNVKWLGKDYQNKLIAYSNNQGETFYARFEYIDYTSYDGQNKSTWLLQKKYNSLEELPPYLLSK